ncbi:MAG: flagellar hook-associated protein FlgL [Betaproteobacteria bacterium]
MRVSTAQIFDTGTFGMQTNQRALLKIQNQMSAGTHILTPADDPVGAAQALVVKQSSSVNSLYKENQASARTRLNLVDANLANVTNELQNVLERAVQAGNSTLSAADRNMVATELQARLESLLDLANTQDGTGQYLYSGFQTQVKPFQVTANAANATPPAVAAFDLTAGHQHVSYAGDSGELKLQVSASVQMSVNVPGSELFMSVKDASGNLVGRSAFDALKNLITNLQMPPSTAPRPSFDQALGDLQSTLDNVLRVRATVGAHLNALDSLGEMSDDFSLQYEQRLSELQDLDYAKAISDLSRRQVQLEAAQKSFAQISQLSLFSLL